MKALEPRALFVHCTAHRLNLVVQDTLDGVRVARGCLASIIENYVALGDSLEAIADDSSSRSTVASTASGFARLLREFRFFFGVRLAHHVLRLTTPAMRSVQGQSQSLSDNLGLIESLHAAVSGQRDKYDQFWEATVSQAETLGVDEPRNVRQSRPPRRLDDGVPPDHPSTPRDAYRRVYLEVVDRLLASLDTRYTGGDQQRLLQAETALRPEMRLALTYVKLLLTPPATSCSAERSFSLLRRLKTNLRSTLIQERLCQAAVLASYPGRLDKLDMEEMRRFVAETPQRTNAFAYIHNLTTTRHATDIHHPRPTDSSHLTTTTRHATDIHHPRPTDSSHLTTTTRHATDIHNPQPTSTI
ncbi:hypothetical protein FJT64_008433 [Amphibalanus amphitrite]|uniref:Zinc finger MYM-type protein 1 n=1 Tax=Amphibalanus amphitrite TaxID=1232801 RepID=A0A6A4VIN1_AMPAM|nr:hypothetical protein FJT64_008433 [Amphibalanus amphitrite]